VGGWSLYFIVADRDFGKMLGSLGTSVNLLEQGSKSMLAQGVSSEAFRNESDRKELDADVLDAWTWRREQSEGLGPR